MASSQRKNVGDLGVWDTLRELEGQVRHFLSERMHDVAWFESGWVPNADLSELVEAYTLEIDLPGVAEDSLGLSLAGNVLTLTGERKPACFVEHDAYRLRERRHGRFERSFELPGGVHQDRVAAVFDNGVLRVTLPKCTHATGQRIHIQVQQAAQG